MKKRSKKLLFKWIRTHRRQAGTCKSLLTKCFCFFLFTKRRYFLHLHLLILLNIFRDRQTVSGTAKRSRAIRGAPINRVFKRECPRQLVLRHRIFPFPWSFHIMECVTTKTTSLINPCQRRFLDDLLFYFLRQCRVCVAKAQRYRALDIGTS